MIRNYRKPLVCASPKTLLRLPAAVSTLQEVAPGTMFHPVLSDPAADPTKVTRIIFVCGKHYYTLAKEVETRGLSNVALVRIEVGIGCLVYANISWLRSPSEEFPQILYSDYSHLFVDGHTGVFLKAHMLFFLGGRGEMCLFLISDCQASYFPVFFIKVPLF